MTVDVIFISRAATPELRALTVNAIRTLIASEAAVKFNIIVFEQCAGVEYENATTHYRPEAINYNAFMNEGIAMGSADYVVMANNDLRFTPGWFSAIHAAMEKHQLLSASPFCPNTQGRVKRNWQEVSFGYVIMREVSGWALVANRKLFDKIGKINEDMRFWYADNVYARQLYNAGIRHGLVKNSVVYHLGSSTLKTLPAQEKNELTVNLKQRFKQKFG